MPIIQKLLLLAAAGAVGTLARYGLTIFVQKHLDGGFPWGTLAVNMAGCFLVGLIYELSRARFAISQETRVILMVGCFGAFTTFATFIFESTRMINDDKWLLLAANITSQNVLGFLFLFLGIFVGRMF